MCSVQYVQGTNMPKSSHAFEEDVVVDIMAELCLEREHSPVFSYHTEIHTLLLLLEHLLELAY